MKKTIYAVLVVLLAMLAVTCDSAIFPASSGAEPGQVAPPEPGLVNLTINVSEGRARALIGTQASTDANYYEAVFVAPNGTDVYRQTWTGAVNGDGGNTFTMTVAIGDYDNSNSTGKGHAIIFAGRSGTGNTLLGVGKITANTGGASPTSDADIKADTTGVTFSIYPLSLTVASDFQTTTPVTSVASVPNSTATANYPVYTIKNDAVTVATYKFNATSMVTAAASNQVTIGAGTVYVTDPETTLDAALAATAVAGYTGATILPNSGTLTSALAGVFTVNIPAIDNDGGFIKLFIQVAVTTVGNGTTGQINKTASSTNGPGGSGHGAGTWYIRGGYNNSTVDPTPITPASDKGGAVLLKLVAPVPSTEVDITVNPTF